MRIKYVLLSIKKSLFVPLILMAVLLGQAIFSGPANAAIITLGSYDIRVGSTIYNQIFDQIQVRVNFGGDFMEPFADVAVVGLDLILSTASVGQTYTVSSGTAFDEAVALLTNGTNDEIWVTVGRYPTEYPDPFSFDYGEGTTEAYFFWRDPTGTDIAGYNINSISLTVNSLTFSTSEYNRNGYESWTKIDFDATLAVTNIPVPATLRLFGSGLIGLIGMSRRKKKI